MRKYIQRVLAFLLVLCLVGAEIPASVFAAPAASSSVTQSTTNSTENSATSSAPVVQDSSVAPIALSSPSGVKVVYNVYKGRTYTEPLKDITYDKTNGFWAYAGNKNIGDANMHPTLGIRAMSWLSGNWIALKLKVPVAGDYVLHQEYALSSSGAMADIFLLPGDTADIETALSTATAVGALDFNGDDNKHNEETDIGAVNIPAAGEYIIVYRSRGGYMFPGNITLNGGANLTAMKMPVTTPKTDIKIGESIKITAVAYLSDPSVTTGITYTYTSLTPATATVSDAGVVKALAEGEIKVKVAASYNGIQIASDEVTLNVAPLNSSGYKIVYNMYKGRYYTEPLKDITFEKTNHFWAYAGNYGAGKADMHPSIGIRVMTGASGNWIALRLNVPYAGDYVMNLEYALSPSGNMADIFVLPGDTADIAVALTTATPIGEIDFKGQDGKYDEEAVIGVVSIPEAGEYIIVYRSRGGYMFPGNITFDGGSKLAGMYMPVSVPKTELKVSESVKLTPKVYLSDQSVTTGITYGYTSLTPATASVDANGVVTALAEGAARIKVTAAYAGEVVAEEEVTLNVVPLNNSGYKVIYDMYRGRYFTEPLKDITYDKTNGFWAYAGNYNIGNADMHPSFGIRAMSWLSGNWIALKLNVPYAGDYVMNLEYALTSSGAMADIFVLPGNTADIAAALTTATPIGEVNFKGEDNKNDEEAVIGIVTIPEAGEYILVYRSRGGYMFPGTVTLDGGNKLSVMQMNATVNKQQIKETETAAITVKTILSNPASKAVTYRFTSLQPEIAKVDASGAIIGVAAGTAKIRVEALINDGEVGAVREVEITVNKLNPSGYYIVYNMFKGRYYTEPLKDITYEGTNDFWAYAGNKDIGKADMHPQMGIRAPSWVAGCWIALKVRVPFAGDYTMQQQYALSENGAIGDVFFLPGDTEDIDAALATAVPVGEINFNGVTGNNKEMTTVGVVSAPTAGEYIVVYRSRGGYMYPGTFTFYGGEKEAIMKMTATSSRTTMKQGEMAQLSAKTYLSDGSVANIVYLYEALTDNFLLNRAGQITAVNLGDAKIKVTAVTPYDRAERIVTIPIRELTPSGTTITVPLLGDFGHGKNVKTITYKDTANIWEYYGTNMDWRKIEIHLNYGIWSQNNWYDYWLAIKVKVNVPGDYQLTQKYAKTIWGGIAEIYSLPVMPVEEVTDALKGLEPIGKFDMYEETLSLPIYTERMGMVNFPEAGEYLIVYKTLKQNPLSDSCHLHLNEIYLDGVNCLKTVTPHQNEVSLNYQQTHQSQFDLRRLDSTLVDPKDCVVTYRSYNPLIASVDENGLVTAVGHGTTTIEVMVYDGVESHSGTYKVHCTDNSGVKEAYIDVNSHLFTRETALAPLTVRLNSGNVYKLAAADTELVSGNESLLTVKSNTVTAQKEGTVTLKATGFFLGEQVSAELTITIVTHTGKSEPTYYTYEMRNNAMENILEYEWCREKRDSTVASAKKLLRSLDIYYEWIPYEGVPRSRQVGFEGDTTYGYCRYCGANVVGLYGSAGGGGWRVDPIDHPWKVQCMDCQRWFPSNDFESFYKLGLDESGHWDYYKSYEENEKLIAKGEKGYLVNVLYPEKGEGWGVDDGFGYRVYKDGTPMFKLQLLDEKGSPKRITGTNFDLAQSANYVALCVDVTWYRIRSYITTFAEAYLYTGDPAYGRAGAVLLDRVCDVASTMNARTSMHLEDFVISCGGTGYGSFVGRIEDAVFYYYFATACDALYPMINDPWVIKYLSRRAEQYGLENDKTSSQKIWENWKNNMLLETWQAAKDGRNQGNFGQTHQPVAVAAIVLDEEPETKEILNWLWKIDNNLNVSGNRIMRGGHLAGALLNEISRDGMGFESSPNYNAIWIRSLHTMANCMDIYEGGDVMSPYEHPRFVNMFMNWDALLLSESHTVQIGDSGDIASLDTVTNDAMYVSIWEQVKDTPLAKRLAQAIYAYKKGNVNLTYDIFHKDPSGIQDEIMALVDKHAEKESQMLPAYGFNVLRDGYTRDIDSQRTVWMYYGFTYGHGDSDVLGIGIEAFGLNLSPDHGYPENTVNNASGHWNSCTLSHNCVMVDEQGQRRDYNYQYPYIFDDSDYVSVMGVETDMVYRQVQEYKRTVVMVKVDEDNSYMVDFFRVLGGEQHTYSFHAQSHGALPLEGLDVELQVNEKGELSGTYAGVDVERGEKGDFHTCYSWLTKVRKDTQLKSNKFVVDFAITDYKGAISNNQNIHLKMTQINNFVPDEVAIAGGYVADKAANKDILKQTDTMEYVLTQRKSQNGEALDSLFTTVFEPYRGAEYIKSVDEVAVKAVAGTPGARDNARALKLTHKSGRVDYVFYASNNTVTYRVDDMFDVRGYVGVYSVDGSKGVEVFRYVTGGDIIVENTNENGVLKGKILDFNRDLTLFGNYIDVDSSFTQEEREALAGRFIYVDNGNQENAVYQIESATPIEGGTRLDIGTSSVIASLLNKNDANGGYNYNIAKGQRYEIPMAYTKTELATNNKLMYLELKGAKLTPAFDPELQDYTSFVGEDVTTIGVRAMAADPNAKVKIAKGREIYNAENVDEISISKGMNTIEVTVTAEDGMTCKTYYIKIYRADHFCYGGVATCQEKAVCEGCGSHYGYVDPNNHTAVELWNGKKATKDAEGYSGDYYCVDCHLLAKKGQVLTYQVPGPNMVLVLLIAGGVLLVGGGSTATILLVKKKKMEKPE